MTVFAAGCSAKTLCWPLKCKYFCTTGTWDARSLCAWWPHTLHFLKK